jgi:carboxyl-terminal processing protease
MTDKLLTMLKSRGRYVVAFLSLSIAFVLSIQFGERGVQFDLDNAEVSASEASSAKKDLSDLKVINKALIRIKDNYVEPERISPSDMLVSALDEVQSMLPAVVVDYGGNREKPKNINVEVHTSTKEFNVAQLESMWELSFRLREIFQFIEQHTEPPEGQDFRDVEYAAINGMLSTLDPHSTLLPPRYYEEMQTQTGGEFGGLGIVISIRDGQLTVISPIDGTPAARKGIQSRDRIVRIGEESTINMNLQDAVNMMRGKPGTDINIWVDRKGWSEPRKFTITRAVIEIKSINSEPLDEKVGYVRIKNFQANTYSDLQEHLKTLKEKMGGMEGLVLDLRDNPGGLLDQAVKVSDLFLDKGTIVSTVGVGNKMREKKTATKSGTEPDYPMMVLVNDGSASASEIVSGALQNNGRALVVGDKTFGKGTVQVMYPFQDKSALKLTIAQYLTPGGVSIQGQGITPDLRVIPALVTDEQVNMFLSDNIVREEDLQQHLSSTAEKVAKDEGLVFIRYLKESVEERDEYEDRNAFERDFQINMSQQLLASVNGTKNRKELLSRIQPELQKIHQREMDAIKAKLAEQDIDWEEGPTPEQASLDFEVTTQKVTENDAGEMVPVEGDSALSSGDTFKMTATVTNSGDKPVYRTKALTESATGVLDDREFLFGHIKPGESKSWTVNVDVPKDLPTRHDVVKFRLSDEKKSFGEPRKHEILLQGLERPQFAFSYDIEDANGDGVFQLDEEVTFDVFVKNVGKADSAETQVYLKNLADEAVYLERGRVKLDSVPKGGQETATFKFRVKEKPKKGEEIKLEVDIYDTTFREYLQKKLSVPYSAESLDVSEASGTVTAGSDQTAVYVAASQKSDVVARLDKGASFPVLAETKKWLEIDFGERSGWVARDSVEYAQGGSAEPSTPATWSWFQAPQVKIATDARITDADSVTLKGTISDNAAVKDYYVFVYHREDASNVMSNKLDYTGVGGPTAQIEQSVPLYQGMNRVAVVARDSDDMQITENVFIYRR